MACSSWVTVKPLWKLRHFAGPLRKEPPVLEETEGIFSTGVAKATSADGSTIVGYAFNYSDPRAFIWDVDNGIRDLKQALLELGVDEVSDWTLSEATDISANGQTIVGVGVNPTGRTQAWAVRLP
jgi:uncharacterized membrane protein